MKTKIKALILALVLLALPVLLFANCGDGGNKPDNAQLEQNSNAGTLIDENGELQPNLPDVKFKGENITFLVRGPGHEDWRSQDIYAETITAEPVNDAVFERNTYLEDKYNVNIKIVPAQEMEKTAKKAASAGDAVYDAVMCSQIESYNLALEGYLLDLRRDVPNINLSQPWWDQNANTDLAIANKLFFTTGDISIMTHDATWMLMFNKPLLEALGLESPYQLVRDNKWTFDKFNAMMKDVAQDLDGDGKMGEEDQWGLGTYNMMIGGLYFASGLRITEHDDKGIPQFAINNPKTMGVIDKCIKIMNPDQVLHLEKLKNPSRPEGWLIIQKIFEENRSLFYGEVIQCVIRLRGMETDFGILPMPKYDESQERYYHQTVPFAGCMLAIPSTVPDDRIDMVGFVIEAMSAKSKYTLQKAYYDKALVAKNVRDIDSEEMLDIVVKSRTYDIGFIYDWGKIYTDTFLKSVFAGKNTFASSYEKVETKATTQKDAAIDKLLSY